MHSKKIFQKLITFIIITTLIWSNVVWAGNCLAPSTNLPMLYRDAQIDLIALDTLQTLGSTDMGDIKVFYEEEIEGKLGRGARCFGIRDVNGAKGKWAFYVIDLDSNEITRFATAEDVNDRFLGALRTIDSGLIERDTYKLRGNKYERDRIVITSKTKPFIKTCLDRIPKVSTEGTSPKTIGPQGVGVFYRDIADGFISEYELAFDLDSGVFTPRNDKNQKAVNFARLTGTAFNALNETIEKSDDMKQEWDGIRNSESNRVQSISVRVNSRLSVDSARYFNSATGSVEIIFSRRFVEEINDGSARNDGRVAVWLIAERLFHELGHDNSQGTREEERKEEKRQILRDAALYLLQGVPEAEVKDYFDNCKPKFRSGYYFRDLIGRIAEGCSAIDIPKILRGEISVDKGKLINAFLNKTFRPKGKEQVDLYVSTGRWSSLAGEGERIILQTEKFPNGEIKVVLEDPNRVAGKNCLLVGSPRTNEEFLEFLFSVQLLKDCNANNVTCVLDNDIPEVFIDLIAWAADVVKLKRDDGTEKVYKPKAVRRKIPQRKNRYTEDTYILAGQDNRSLGGSLARETGAIYGEWERRGKGIYIPEDIKNKDCLLVHTARNNDELADLFIILYELAKVNPYRKVTCLVPYFSYARQHKSYTVGKNGIGGNSAKAILKALDRLCDELITINIHFFDRTGEQCLPEVTGLPICNLNAFRELAYWHKQNIPDLHRPILVAPDKGAFAYVREAARKIGWDCDYLEKTRVSPTEVRMKLEKLDVMGRDVIILDDIIATGGTMITAAGMLKKQGAKRVFLGGVHGEFSRGTSMFTGTVDGVVCTKTLRGEKNIVSLAPLLKKFLSQPDRFRKDTVCRVKLRDENPNIVIDSLSEQLIRVSKYASGRLAILLGLFEAGGIFEDKGVYRITIYFKDKENYAYFNNEDKELAIHIRDDIPQVDELVRLIAEALDVRLDGLLGGVIEDLKGVTFKNIDVVLQRRLNWRGDIIFVYNTAYLLKKLYPNKTIRAVFYEGFSDLCKMDERLKPDAEKQELDGIEFYNVKKWDSSKDSVALIYNVESDTEYHSADRSVARDAPVRHTITELGVSIPYMEPESIKSEGDFTLGFGEGLNCIGLSPVSLRLKDLVRKIKGYKARRYSQFRKEVIYDMFGDKVDSDAVAQTDWGFIYAHNIKEIERYFMVFSEARRVNASYGNRKISIFALNENPEFAELCKRNGYNVFEYNASSGAGEYLNKTDSPVTVYIVKGTIPQDRFIKLSVLSRELPSLITGQNTMSDIVYISAKLGGRPFFWETFIWQYDEEYGFVRLNEGVLEEDEVEFLRMMYAARYEEKKGELAKVFYDNESWRRVFKKGCKEAIKRANFGYRVTRAIEGGWSDYIRQKIRGDVKDELLRFLIKTYAVQYPYEPVSDDVDRFIKKLCKGFDFGADDIRRDRVKTFLRPANDGSFSKSVFNIVNNWDPQETTIQMIWGEKMTAEGFVNVCEHFLSIEGLGDEEKEYLIMKLLLAIVSSTLGITGYSAMKPLSDMILVDGIDSENIRRHAREFRNNYDNNGDKSKKIINLIDEIYGKIPDNLKRFVLKFRSRIEFYPDEARILNLYPKEIAWVREHAKRVARLSEIIAVRMGFSRDFVRLVRLAGLAHDIGKGCSPKMIAAVNSAETPMPQIIATHGEEIVGMLKKAGIVMPDNIVIDAIRYHHNPWDLEDGYAKVLAEIIFVADQIEASQASRPYDDSVKDIRVLLSELRWEYKRFERMISKPVYMTAHRLLADGQTDFMAVIDEARNKTERLPDRLESMGEIKLQKYRNLKFMNLPTIRLDHERGPYRFVVDKTHRSAEPTAEEKIADSFVDLINDALENGWTIANYRNTPKETAGILRNLLSGRLKPGVSVVLKIAKNLESNSGFSSDPLGKKEMKIIFDLRFVLDLLRYYKQYPVWARMVLFQRLCHELGHVKGQEEKALINYDVLLVMLYILLGIQDQINDAFEEIKLGGELNFRSGYYYYLLYILALIEDRKEREAAIGKYDGFKIAQKRHVLPIVKMIFSSFPYPNKEEIYRNFISMLPRIFNIRTYGDDEIKIFINMLLGHAIRFLYDLNRSDPEFDGRFKSDLREMERVLREKDMTRLRIILQRAGVSPLSGGGGKTAKTADLRHPLVKRRVVGEGGIVGAEPVSPLYEVTFDEDGGNVKTVAVDTTEKSGLYNEQYVVDALGDLVKEYGGPGILSGIKKAEIVDRDGPVGSQVDGKAVIDIDMFRNKNLVLEVLEHEFIHEILGLIIPDKPDLAEVVATWYSARRFLGLSEGERKEIIDLLRDDSNGLDPDGRHVKFLEGIAEGLLRPSGARNDWDQVITYLGVTGVGVEEAMETDRNLREVIKLFNDFSQAGNGQAEGKRERRTFRTVSDKVRKLMGFIVRNKKWELPEAKDTQKARYIVVDKDRKKGVLKIEEELLKYNIRVVTEIPQDGNFVVLVDPKDIGKWQGQTLPYLPLPYMELSLKMAGSMLLSGRSESIDNFIKGFYEILLSRVLTNDEVTGLFTKPWWILPEISKLTEDLDILHEAIDILNKNA